MQQGFVTAAVMAASTSMAKSFLGREPHDWTMKVSMADYTTHYFENQIDHFNEKDERMYK